MSQSTLLKDIQILHGPNSPVKKDSVLIKEGLIFAFGKKALAEAKKLNILPTPSSSNLLLAPCLVDPHSILEEPVSGKSESLSSLCKAAATCGYGQLALLPRSSSWRDRPERLQGLVNHQNDVIIHLWGSFSLNGKGDVLSSHADLLQHGAIGLAEDDSIPPLELLQRGLLLGEMGTAPFLVAPRDKKLQGEGLVREGVETLRAGWPPDPITSETLPLAELIELNHLNKDKSLRLMNISTLKGVEMLKSSKNPPMSSVSWWHIVADRTTLNLTSLGWRVTPSLGGEQDRRSLINALKEGIITAIAVHSVPLDDEEIQLSPDKRIPGLAGHHLVLPLLWQELIVKEKWSVDQLWNSLSFGPSRLLKTRQEKISPGSRRWLLFDPDHCWTQTRNSQNVPKAANQPMEGCELKGKVIDCGLKNREVDPSD
ncbi:dihydroorotase [Prochlorococcus sp. MIT 1341]|uniref:dihydroorotase n=1 Tax=Prochlorococcus sp. MIT 1341 TaxID=3096221 RepID=UPI002A749988|nr:dihydroorotase [Prochlorococcus sp. MIT 1341]